MTRPMRSFGAFAYDFVIGDDWHVVAVVVTAPASPPPRTAAGVNAWWLVPVAAFAALAWSLRRATGGKFNRRRTAPSRRLQLREVALRVAVVPELFLKDGVEALLQRVRAVLEHVDHADHPIERS